MRESIAHGGRHLGERDRLRRGDGRHRPAGARGGGDPARDGSLGYASAVAVVTAVLAAITLLPACSRSLGHAHRVGSACPRSCARSRRSPRAGFWGRWARVRHDATRGSAIAASLALCVPLIDPVLLAEPRPGGHRRDADRHDGAPGLRPRWRAGFGVGYNGPLLIAVKLGQPGERRPEVQAQEDQANGLQDELEQEQKRGQEPAAALQAAGGRAEGPEQALTVQQQAARAAAGAA